MSVAISWANKMQLAKCDIMVGFPISSHKSGADLGEGHRGQMTPPSETYQGSQKMMYLYENNEFKLSYQYFYKIKTVYLLRICTHHTPCSMHRVWSSGGG